jgi:hypothetical protein
MRFNARNLQGEMLSNLRPNRNPARRPYDGTLTARAISLAVDDAAHYLLSLQQPDGSIGDNYGRDVGGYTALAALSLLAAGRNPASDDALHRALDYLVKVDPDSTYVRGIRANVWEYALRKVPYDTAIQNALKNDYEWLIKALGDKEGWRYQMGSPDWDNSVTQYGVLGVWAAARAGLSPGDDFWKRMSAHFRSVQNEDGGWGYQRSSSTANMATAGLATLFLVFDMYHGKSYYSAENPRAFSSGEAEACLASIQRGMQWLGKNGGSNSEGYYLYGIERTGVAGGRKYIGGHDWFREGASEVLQRLQTNGSIATQGHGGEIGNTAFSALFLVHGGAPVAFSKLEYGGDQDWNLNPRDLANLTKDLWSAYERPLNWQSVGIDAPVEEFDAPILFISGSRAAEFTQEETAKLKAYVEGGGTILAEPSDHSLLFRDSMVKLLGAMFPAAEYPGVALRPLPEDHGVYTVLRQAWDKRPQLLGAGDGSRMFFLLSEENLSADWQMNRAGGDAFKLAMNLLFYATDLKTLEGKFATILPDSPAAAPREAVAAIARVRFTTPADAPQDWAVGRPCWKRFAPYFKHISGVGLEEREPVRLGRDDLKGVRLLHLTGTRAFTLGEEERQALKDYVEQGGAVLVDAYAGSRTFAESARRELNLAFGELEPLKDESPLASGRFLGGADLAKGLTYTLTARQRLRRESASTKRQQLWVCHRGDRPAVVFSELDLTAALAGIDNYQAEGYKPESARKVAGNLLAYWTAD